MDNLSAFEQYGLVAPPNFDGDEFWAYCPVCKDSHQTPVASVAVYPALGTWLCKHCGWRGNLGIGASNEKSWMFKEPVLPVYHPAFLTKNIESWFNKNNISDSTIKHYEIGMVNAWNPKTHQVEQAIAFPYKLDGVLVNLKYRFGNRSGSFFETGSEIIPFGMDDINEECTIICSDEVEKLMFFNIGIKNVISLPFPPPPIPQAKKNDVHNLQAVHECLSFLEKYGERFKDISKFILFIGGDKNSQILTEELARRLGRERCWSVKFPDDKLSVRHVYAAGQELVQEMLHEAKAFPVKGVFEISDVKEQFDLLYERGLPPGPRTGWPSLDEHYRPALGQWTLVTGIPSHGKSNWLDALFCNLADLHDWKFCIFSPENQPIARHFVNLAEKHIGTAFNPKDKNDPKMTKEEKKEAEKWLGEHFTVVLPDDEEGNWTIEGILELARSVILRKGVQGLIIDPWNELDHTRQPGMSETEHVSRVISKIRQFARAHSVHVWLVAHPTKMYKDENGIYPVPTPYDVAGSAHFLNKADFSISIYRFVGQPDQTITDVYIQKVRFKENGLVGRISLRYLPGTGQFIDDLDQGKRAGALNANARHPAEYFIRGDKVRRPEFHED